MATTTKSGKRWGFLEKALAGVESRLDNILGEDEDDAKNENKPATATLLAAEKSEAEFGTEAPKVVEPITIGITATKRPDRLQERLAKAMVNRNVPGSGSVTPSNPATSPRTSLDRDAVKDSVSVVNSSIGTPASIDAATHVDVVAEKDVPTIQLTLDQGNISSGTADTQATPSANGISTPRKSLDSDVSDTRQQQEAHDYLEQIESLRAKLQFLTQQATAEAKERAQNADKGSMQQQLAEKDEKIALLLEEGSKLGHTEMKLMTTIKSLRAKSAEDQKLLAKAKQNEEQSQRNAKGLQEKLKSMETSTKDDSKQKTMLDSLRKDLEQARNESKAKAADISDLQKQVLQNAIASQETEKIRKELEAERKTSKDLKEEISDARLERSLLEDRSKAQLKEYETKAERKLQDATAIELDLRRELQVMESRLENFQTRAEEISSDNKGNVQAKLVRQIETLQSSYSVASENWRGIESSLMARIAAYEKDQSEAQKKEAELRRKLRELTTKHKELETQLETSRSQVQELEESLAKVTEESKQESSSLMKAETDLKAAQNDLKQTKDTMLAQLERLESEKRDAVQESLSLRTRLQSPMLKTGIEPSISSSRRYPQSPGLAFPSGLGFHEQPASRRASRQLPANGGPERKGSSVSLARSNKSSMPPTPVISADDEDDDDFFANTPTTPPERTIHDMVSTSTAGAGPSVQLVERMSAAVRRLESEKEASKYELERLSAQRDEARNQVVSLMQEVEDKKKAEEKMATMEREIQELNDKLQTTLEMLGEKSELVEELRADIADMKDIYRATLESTVK